MYELNGWSLVEVNSARLHFVNGKLKVDVMIVYPTMTSNGKQVIYTYIDSHRVGVNHASIQEAMDYVSSNHIKWLDRGYRKGCEYTVNKKYSYQHWMEYYKMTDEEEDSFSEGWAKSHGV